MTNACLVDSNILVYAYDNSTTEKQQIAVDLLDRLAFQDSGILTAQTLAEFYSVATRRIRQPLDHSEAGVALMELAASFSVYEMTLAIVLEAARGVREHGLSYWDAQVWASAKLNQIPIILTEDMPSAGVIEGIRFINPFDSDLETQRALTSLGLAE